MFVVQVFYKDFSCFRSCEGKLMRMHTALKLNETIKNKSLDAELVIVNFPAPPSKLAAEENCILC